MLSRLAELLATSYLRYTYSAVFYGLGLTACCLRQDISSQVTVIGRIAPEQVLDYVKKLRYSSRTSIGLVKFTSPKEERIGYDAFFDYLDSRKRYGVVGNTGKALKDFYILPLPKNGDIPDVLLPLDGPGICIALS